MPDERSNASGKWIGGALALVVLVVGVAAIGALLSGEDADEPAAPTSEPVAAPTTTVLETTTTTDPATTTTTSLGFEPFTIDGSGDETVAFEAPDDLATVLHITHEGQSAFSVTTLDSESEVVEVLVDTEGGYEGSRAINLVVGDVISAIEVVGDGAWSITATYLGDLERLADEATGSGDAVLLMDITRPAMAITHDGVGDFSVFVWTFDDSGYLVQETGRVDTMVSVPTGGTVVEILADGNWRLSAAG